MQKRGVSLNVELLIALALGAIIFFIILNLTTRTTTQTGKPLTETQQAISLQACQVKGYTLVARSPTSDADNDGLPDSCDPCLNSKDTNTQGNILDEDGDGIPNNCDFTGATSREDACKKSGGTWLKTTSQCSHNKPAQ